MLYWKQKSVGGGCAMGLWVPKLRAEYIIEGALYQEALDYARRSRAYTSDRHDFHSGGLDNKQQKMLEGKLGERRSSCSCRTMASGLRRITAAMRNGTSMTSCSRARGCACGWMSRPAPRNSISAHWSWCNRPSPIPRSCMFPPGSIGSGMRSGCWGGSPGRICSPRGRSKTRATWITM